MLARKGWYRSPARLLIILTVSIASIEVALMVLLHSLVQLPWWLVSLVDTVVLVVLMVPLLYSFLIRPMTVVTADTRRAEEALRDSDERFRWMTENTQDIIFRYRFTPTPGYEYISPAVTAITGYTPEEFLADPDLDVKIVHPDDRETLQRIIAQNLIDPCPLRWMHKDGAITWMEHRTVPVYEEDGKLVAVEGISRDITVQKRLEEQLKRVVRSWKAR